jgi:hypothetical protein
MSKISKEAESNLPIHRQAPDICSPAFFFWEETTHRADNESNVLENLYKGNRGACAGTASEFPGKIRGRATTAYEHIVTCKYRNIDKEYLCQIRHSRHVEKGEIRSILSASILHQIGKDSDPGCKIQAPFFLSFSSANKQRLTFGGDTGGDSSGGVIRKRVLDATVHRLGP